MINLGQLSGRSVMMWGGQSVQQDIYLNLDGHNVGFIKCKIMGDACIWDICNTLLAHIADAYHYSLNALSIWVRYHLLIPTPCNFPHWPHVYNTFRSWPGVYAQTPLLTLIPKMSLIQIFIEDFLILLSCSICSWWASGPCLQFLSFFNLDFTFFSC